MPAPALRRPLLLALPRAQRVLSVSSSFTVSSRRCKSTGPSSGGGPPIHAPSPSHSNAPSDPPAGAAGGGVSKAPDAPETASPSPLPSPPSPPPPPQDATGHVDFLRRLEQRQQKPQQQPGPMADLATILRSAYPYPPRRVPPPLPPLGGGLPVDGGGLPSFSSFALASQAPLEDDHRLHIFSTKHNTHITFAKPNNDCIVSKSTGDVGFRKAQRGSYDAAHQLAASVFRAIEAKGVRPRSVEVLLRGFGQGREAAIKALLGQEGKFLRPVLKRFTDSTRIKFGGTRSKKPRRLG